MTPCMPCSFGLLQNPRSACGALRNSALGVTLTVRWIPLVTAACGTWMARPVRTTMLAAGGDGSQAGRRGEARPRWPPVSVASREGGPAAAMAAKLSAAAVSGPPAKSDGQVRRTAALTLVIGLPRMSRLPSHGDGAPRGDVACQRGDGSDR